MIDGIISGKILLKPKIMSTRRGTPYLIAKMRIFGYQTGNIASPELHGDVIAFDAAVCRVLQGMDAGMLVSVFVASLWLGKRKPERLPDA